MQIDELDVVNEDPFDIDEIECEYMSFDLDFFFDNSVFDVVV